MRKGSTKGYQYIGGRHLGNHQVGRSDFNAGHGLYNMICDRCGFKVKSDHMKREWTGLMVCDETINDCWEPRQPQDFVRGIPDPQSVNPSRPDQRGILPVYYQYPCIAGIMVSGISIAGTDYIKSGVALPEN